MKTLKFIIISVIILYSTCSFAQQISGLAIYKYKFNLGKMTKDTLIGNLYFDNHGESYYVVKNNSKIFQTTTNTTTQEKILNEVPSQKKGLDSSIVYRNLITKKQFYTKSVFTRNYLISDTLKEIQWSLLPEQKKIGKFSCNSAKTKFAGRNYTVWYTMDVPVSTGPWKLYGLPGIIVEFYDDLGLIYYVLDKIEIKKEAVPKPYKLEDLFNKSNKKEEFKKQEKIEEERLKSMVISQGSEVQINKGKGMELEEN